MIKSMTGYGQARRDDGERSVAVEIRTLNSKFTDITIRLPKLFNEKETEIRNLATERLERGKISITIEYARLTDDFVPVEINSALFKNYYNQLKNLAEDVGAGENDIFKMALMYPDVQIQKQDSEILGKDWEEIRKTIVEAIDKCDFFRKNEGVELSNKFFQYLDNIDQYLSEVEKHDPNRLVEVKERLRKSLDDLKLNGEVDKNRFEQELIYYIEKLDICEEKVRLKSHIEYFRQVLNAETSQGKKLNFISQEMGREINTMGSKANYTAIQKLVVSMKDELEKIKEQLQNIV